MKAYTYLIDTLREAFEDIPLVTSVTTGSLDDIDNYKQTLFPLVHIIVNNMSPESNILRFNVTIMAMDIVDISQSETTDRFRGNDNEQEVLNTTSIILIRVAELLRRGELNDRLEILGNASCEPFTERFENLLAGWAMTLDIILPNEMSIC
jgi:hypothetical protein